MIETILIHEFLRTGGFGGLKELHFGMTKEKFDQILGESEWQDFSNEKSKSPSIYGFGKVEFYFEEGAEGRLTGIQIQPDLEASKKSNLKINYEFLAAISNYKEALKTLNQFAIKFDELLQDYDGEDVKRIETEGRVQIVFSQDYESSSFLLHKISKFITLNSDNPNEHQINFSVEGSEYELLEAIGNEQGKSVAQICRENILDWLKTQN